MSPKAIPGSLAAIALRDGVSLATSFTDADVLVLIDISASMKADDARGGRTRYTAACDELTRLQANYPGRVAVISFSSTAAFCPAGLPGAPYGTTDLAGALRYAQVADGCGMTIVVISDGEPDDEDAALAAAAL